MAAVKTTLGYSGIKAISSLGLDVGKFGTDHMYAAIEYARGLMVTIEKYGIKVNVLYVSNKAKYLDGVAERMGKLEFDKSVSDLMELDPATYPTRQAAIDALGKEGITQTSMTQTIRSEIRSTDGGYLGEYVTKDELLLRQSQDPSFKVLGDADGFYKTGTEQQGYDFLCWDDKNKMYVVVEAKGISDEGNIGKDLLKDEMTDGWIRLKVQSMYDKGLISDDLKKQLETAVTNNKIRKELYVVQDVPYNENTVKTDLVEYGFDRVNIIKMGVAT